MVFNSGYHDVNVCYYGRTMIYFNKTPKNVFHHIRKEVVAIFTDVTDFDNEHKFTSVIKQTK